MLNQELTRGLPMTVDVPKVISKVIRGFIMKVIAHLMAAAVATTAISPAAAGGFDGNRFRDLVKTFHAWKPRVPIEMVRCAAADGSTVAFSTTTTGDKHLVGPVTVVSGSQRALVSPEWVSTYRNKDDGMAIEAYRPNAVHPFFAFKTELVPTTAPKTDEVGTYAGTMAVFGKQKAVTCSAFQKGAGTLAAQPYPMTSDLNFVCQRVTASGDIGDTLFQTKLRGSQSQRLFFDLKETRAIDDFETLSMTQVSKYNVKKIEFILVSDDIEDVNLGGVDLTIDLIGKRVPPAQTGVWGFWTGTYKRAAPGRELEAKVTCGAYVQ